MILISSIRNWIVGFLLVLGASAKSDVVKMKVFTRDQRVLGSSVVQVPTAPGQKLVVGSNLYRCEVNNLDISAKSSTVQISFFYETASTSLQAGVDLTKIFQISLNDQYFCQIEWIEAN